MGTGYTTIEINGKSIGIKFGLTAIRQIADKEAKVEFSEKYTDPKTGEITDTLSEIAIVHIIYAGYRNWCLTKDIEPSINFETVYEFVEDCIFKSDIAPLKQVIDTYAGSKYIAPVLAAHTPIPASKKKHKK